MSGDRDYFLGDALTQMGYLAKLVFYGKTKFNLKGELNA
jgi:hypothetical protein